MQWWVVFQGFSVDDVMFSKDFQITKLTIELPHGVTRRNPS